MLSLACYTSIKAMTTAGQKAKSLIDAISQEAQEKWGKDWLAPLVTAYCEIESAETDKLIKPVQRRSQLVRALETGNPTAETLMRLTQAVNGHLDLTFIRKEVKRF